MITSFEVGAVFKIIDEGSPALKRILAEVRALNKAIKESQASLSASTAGLTAGMAPALAETRALAAEWKAVSAAAQGARRSIASASKAAATPIPVAALAAVNSRQRLLPGNAGGGNGGRGNGGGNGAGGLHVSSLATPIPGGHAYFRGGGGNNAALAGAGALAYGLYEESVLQDQIFLMQFHAGMKQSTESSKYFRDLIQTTAAKTGFGYKEIAEAATDEIRLMKGADGKASGGLAILPEMLQAAATETRLKPGTTFKTAMESLIQAAHMAQEYGVEDIKGMAPLLAFLSTTNPARLPQMVRAASYAMPTLHSGLNVNPADVLMDTTAIARAGATNTKSGTWVEKAYQRMLPPDPRLVSPKEYERRMIAMKVLGLADEKGKSTVLSADGKTIDMEKAKNLVFENSNKMGIEERSAMIKKNFGEQGSRGIDLLMSPQVRAQTKELRREFPDFQAQYPTFMEDYANNSPIQKMRQTKEELTNVLSDIGSVALPPVTQALHDFSDALKAIKSVMPDGGDKDKEKGKDGVWGKVGAKVLEGAAVGALGGSFVPGIGTLTGGMIGGMVFGGFELLKQTVGNKDNDKLKDTPPIASVWDSLKGNTTKDLAGIFKFGGEQYKPSAPVPTFGAGATPISPFGMAAGGLFQGFNQAVDTTKDKAAAAAPAVSGLSSAIEGLMGAARSFMNMGTVPLHQGSTVPAPPSGGGGGEKHSAVYLDRKKVGALITRDIADRGNRPSQGSAYHDSTHGTPASDLGWSTG